MKYTDAKVDALDETVTSMLNNVNGLESKIELGFERMSKVMKDSREEWRLEMKNSREERRLEIEERREERGEERREDMEELRKRFEVMEKEIK